jgi:hypothetical protein
MILLNIKTYTSKNQVIGIQANTTSLDTHSILSKVNPETDRIYAEELGECLILATLEYLKKVELGA